MGICNCVNIYLSALSPFFFPNEFMSLNHYSKAERWKVLYLWVLELHWGVNLGFIHFRLHACVC